MTCFGLLCPSSGSINITDKAMVVLQNFMDSLKVVPGPCNQTCHDENQVINIKAEEVTDFQEEEDSFITTFPEIKVEHEVSFMGVCMLVGTFVTCLELHIIGHVACLENMRNVYKIRGGKLKVGEHLGVLNIDGMIKLKLHVKVFFFLSYLNGSRLGPSLNSEHGSEPLDFIKYTEFLDHFDLLLLLRGAFTCREIILLCIAVDN